MFKHEDAIILGKLLAPYFVAPRQPGFLGSYANDFPYLFGGNDNDGSGGFPGGRNGKAAYKGSGGDLSGIGGGQEAGGDGACNGLLGYGGNGRGYTSAGGGGGWYGGGSGYTFAGGGGGSSGVWDENTSIEGYMDLVAEFGEGFEKSAYYGYDSDFGYNQKIGNGKVKINGNIVFEYTGSVQEYVIPAIGVYVIECWGAQGGGFTQTGGPESKYSGGQGGYAKASFNLVQGTKLFIYVGQQGSGQKAPVRPFGLGGGAKGSCLAGGGASDVRLVAGNLLSRLIVGGGGGGCGGGGSGSDFLGMSTRSLLELTGQGVIRTKSDNMYLISDISIATVDLRYLVSEDIGVDATLKVILYIDGYKRGEIEHNAIAGGGQDSFKFSNFDEWLAPGTVPYWAKVSAVVEPKGVKQLAIPVGGLIIRIDTKLRQNDSKENIVNILTMFAQVKFRAYSKAFTSVTLQETASSSLYVSAVANARTKGFTGARVYTYEKEHIKIGVVGDLHSGTYTALVMVEPASKTLNTSIVADLSTTGLTKVSMQEPESKTLTVSIVADLRTTGLAKLIVDGVAAPEHMYMGLVGDLAIQGLTKIDE